MTENVRNPTNTRKAVRKTYATGESKYERNSRLNTARALAKHYMAVLAGLLSPGMLAKALTPPDRSSDPVKGWERFGLGYILWDGGVFGHGGALGAEGFAVPERGLAVGFATDTLAAAHPVRDRISEELGLPPRVW